MSKQGTGLPAGWSEQDKQPLVVLGKPATSSGRVHERAACSKTHYETIEGVVRKLDDRGTIIVETIDADTCPFALGEVSAKIRNIRKAYEKSRSGDSARDPAFLRAIDDLTNLVVEHAVTWIPRTRTDFDPITKQWIDEVWDRATKSWQRCAPTKRRTKKFATAR